MQLTHRGTLGLAILAGLNLAATQPAAAQIIAGQRDPSPTAANSIPFGDSPGSSYPLEYQQLYNPTDFSSTGGLPFRITSIGFGTDSTNTGSPGSASYSNVTLSLGIASTTYNNPSSNFAANGSLTPVFTGPLTTTLTNSNAFDLIFNTTPFVYTPGSGALLLDVKLGTEPNLTGNAGQNNPDYFMADTGTTRTYSVSTFSGSTATSNGGLVTRFGGAVVPSAAVVPEASGAANMTGALLALGVGGLILRVRTKRALKKATTEEANA